MPKDVHRCGCHHNLTLYAIRSLELSHILSLNRCDMDIAAAAAAAAAVVVVDDDDDDCMLYTRIVRVSTGRRSVFTTCRQSTPSSTVRSSLSHRPSRRGRASLTTTSSSATVARPRLADIQVHAQ